MQGNVAEDTRPETATRPTGSAARHQGAHAPQVEPGRGKERQRSASPHPTPQDEQPGSRGDSAAPRPVPQVDPATRRSCAGAGGRGGAVERPAKEARV